MLSSLALGAMFGAQHVLAGPDHLAAVAPLSARASGAWRVGLAWGLGHGLVTLALGVSALLLGHVLGLDAFARHAEQLVGASIVALGLWTLWRGQGVSHTHEAKAGTGVRAAFLVGILHGLGGGLHLAGLLPAAALASPWLYLFAFVAASVAAMTAVTSLAGPWLGAPERRERAVKFSALAAIVVGCAWIALA